MPNNKWTKIGAAFPHKEGAGFSIELKAFPVDGRLVVLPSDNDRRSEAYVTTLAARSSLDTRARSTVVPSITRGTRRGAEYHRSNK
jgi:hypothetical protein